MNWYYAQGSEQQGPTAIDALGALIIDGTVNANTMVWREGMADWLPARDVPELAIYFSDVVMPETPAPGPSPTPGPPGASSPYQSPSGGAQPAGHPGTPIPNYLVPSILVTLFCCWPFGIPAIIFAAKVDGLVARGQYAEALEASNNAKMWYRISLGVGLVVTLLYFLVMAGGVLSGM